MQVLCRCCKVSCDVPSACSSSEKSASPSCSLAVVGLRRKITRRLTRLRSRTSTSSSSRVFSPTTTKMLRAYNYHLTAATLPIHASMFHAYCILLFSILLNFLTLSHNRCLFSQSCIQPTHVHKHSGMNNICRLTF